MVTRVCSAAVALAVVAAPLAAQIEKGDREVNIGASLNFSSGSGVSNTTGSVTGALQYYMTQQFALRGAVMEMLSAGGGTTSTMTYLDGGVEYNFTRPNEKTVPFVFADISVLTGSGVSSTSISPGAGVKYFFNRTTALRADARLFSASGTTTILTNVGIAIFFPKDSK